MDLESKVKYELEGPLPAERINYGEQCETDDEVEDEFASALDSMHLVGSHLMLCAESKQPKEVKTTEKKDVDGDSTMKKESFLTDSEVGLGDSDDEDDEEDEMKRETSSSEPPTFENCEPQDEADDDHLRWLEEVLIHTSNRLRIVGRITKNVYRVHVYDPMSSTPMNACLKIARKSQSRQSDKAPMELRVLSYLTRLSDTKHLQQMSHCFIGKHVYAFVAPFMPALSELPDVLHWNQTPERIVGLMRDVLCALHLLHSNGIIHRDVKPSNVFWDKDHGVLADFGFATWSTPKGHFSRMGTHGYMAPEMLAWERDYGTMPQRYDHRCDLYSAGMLFGSLLFGMKEKYVQERDGPLFRTVTPKYFAPHISSTIQALLQIDPARRPSALDAIKMLQIDYC